MVRATIKFPTNARDYGYGNWHTTGAETGIRQMVTDCTMAVGSCREWWCIPVNDTYVQVKSNESAYKGVKLRVSKKEFNRKEMSVHSALRATQEAAGWFTLHW